MMNREPSLSVAFGRQIGGQQRDPVPTSGTMDSAFLLFERVSASEGPVLDVQSKQTTVPLYRR